MAFQPLDFDERHALAAAMGVDVTDPIFINATEQQLIESSIVYGIRTKPFVVDLPGITDVIHLTPSKPFTVGERDIWQRLGKGVTPAEARQRRLWFFGADFVKNAEVRAERARRMFTSPQPDIYKYYTDILTKIDDTQDALVTLSYLSRVGLIGLRKIAPRLAAKFIPGVGVISAAADLIDIYKIGKTYAPVLFGGKDFVDMAASRMSKGRRTAGKASKNLSALLPSAAEVIQIAQTTDQVFGVGLSIGPLYSAIADYLFGTALYGIPEGREVVVKGIPTSQLPTIKQINQLMADPEIIQSPAQKIFSKPLTTADLAAIRALRNAPMLLTAGNTLSDNDIVSVYTSIALAVEQLTSSGVMDGSLQRLSPLLDVVPQRVEVSDAVMQDINDFAILSHQPAADAKDALPLLEFPVRIQQALLQERLREGVMPALKRLQSQEAQAYCDAVIAAYTEPLLRLYFGNEIDIKTEPSPPFKAMFDLAHYNINATHQLSDEQAARLISLIATEYYLNPSRRLTYGRIKALLDIIQ